MTTTPTVAKLLLILLSINTVASQLCLKRGVTLLGGIHSLGGLPRFALSAATSPWIITSLSLQVAGYVMWMIVVTREKLGIAVALTGASFYILMAFSAWYFYDERLTLLQSIGIGLIIFGVVCVALPMTTP
jgi:drug/metabolite transporter (DMT)-like permease